MTEPWRFGRLAHGHRVERRFSPTYQTWLSMRRRCRDKRNKWYGARGIRVCQRWLRSFANFLEDMGQRPDGATLDRKNRKLGYFPENCQWSDATTQRRDRSSVRITLDIAELIRSTLASGSYSDSEIARAFDCGAVTVRGIRIGRLWNR